MPSIIGLHRMGRHDKVKHPKCSECHPGLVADAPRVVIDNPPPGGWTEADKVPAKPRKQRTLREAIESAPIINIDAPFGKTRETWLMEAVERLRPTFESVGFPIPEKVRVSVGWPGGRGKKTGVIGQCWPVALSSDATHAIFISPVVTDPVEVLATLVHELVHASVPAGTSHRGAFVKAARTIGLVAPWTGTSAGPELKPTLEVMAEQLGGYDHAGLSSIGRLAVQTTRMLKVACPDCGCIIRMTRTWIENAGTPTCGCGGEMSEAGA